MRKLFRAQMDLFVVSLRPAELTGVERQTAVALLQTLLRGICSTPQLGCMLTDSLPVR